MANSFSLGLYPAARNHGRTLENIDNYSSRPNGALVWFHTGHDPQALAVRELANRLISERDDLHFLFTTSAETGVESSTWQEFTRVPNETRADIRHFLDHWRPDIAVWTEPDLRRALINEVNQRHIPLIFADARTATPVPATRRWWHGTFGTPLSRFAHILTGDATTAAHYERLGARPETIEIKGFLEEGAPALPYHEADRNALALGLGGRPVWLAMRVTDTELAPVISAHNQAQRRAHRLLLILVPDDLSKGPDWAVTLTNDGHIVALRSAGQEPERDTQIYVADGPGEAGLWYRLAAIAYLGQSLDGGGGVNPFAAAALGSAILHGPDIQNFRRAYDRLATVGATRLVRGADTLGDMVEALLSPDIAASMAHEAWRVCSSGAEVTDRMIDLILTGLDARETA